MEGRLFAADIMVREVVTIGPEESVARASALMTANDVSALPVISTEGRLVGIISEADLLRREEIGTAISRPSWVEAITPAATLAADFVKSHGKRVADLMSKDRQCQFAGSLHRRGGAQLHALHREGDRAARPSGGNARGPNGRRSQCDHDVRA